MMFPQPGIVWAGVALTRPCLTFCNSAIDKGTLVAMFKQVTIKKAYKEVG